jgi:CubicO group peptidase (beta-lactamase class C family)
MKKVGGKFFLLFAIILLLFSSCVNTITANFENEMIPWQIANQNSIFDDLAFNLRIRLIMQLGHFPSISACIIKNDSIVWYKGYGRAKLFPRKAPTPDTIYAVGSLSKPVTATAVMQLWERGYFDLDDDINDYLDFSVRNPYYPDTPITFRMLLAHYSGLTDNENLHSYYLFLLYMLNKKDYPYPLIKDVITPEGKFYRPDFWEDFKPGTRRAYTNLNYMLLEHIIEAITGQSFTDFCEKNIFEPLNMTNTSFYFDDLKDKELAGAYHNLGSLYFPIPYIDVGYSYGGMKTSISDFSQFVLAYINEGVWNGYRLLNESTVKMMLTVQFQNTSSYNYSRQGLGWQYFGSFLGSRTFGHIGHTPGGSGAVFMNITDNFAQVFFINRYLFFIRPRILFAWFTLISNFATKIREF